MSEVEKAKKILNAIDKTVKPISSVVAVILDDHRIGWLARIPREIKQSLDAIQQLFEEEQT